MAHGGQSNERSAGGAPQIAMCDFILVMFHEHGAWHASNVRMRGADARTACSYASGMRNHILITHLYEKLQCLYLVRWLWRGHQSADANAISGDKIASILASQTNTENMFSLKINYYYIFLSII